MEVKELTPLDKGDGGLRRVSSLIAKGRDQIINAGVARLLTDTAYLSRHFQNQASCGQSDKIVLINRLSN